MGNTAQDDATGAAANAAPGTSPAATQAVTPATGTSPTDAQREEIAKTEGTQAEPPVKAANHGPLGEDVVYIATAADAQVGINEGQPLAGKIVKVIKDDEVNRILICNLHLFAADSSGLIFKAGIELGQGEGKFLFN